MTFLFVFVTLSALILHSESSAQKAPQVLYSVKTVDSLKRVISGLVSTDYDQKIASLKKIHEYKHAIFVTPCETREYLKIFSEQSGRFKSEKIYRYSNDTLVDNGTIEYMTSSGMCKIVFDTTQSVLPLAIVTEDFYESNKNLKTKKETFSNSTTVCKFFYLPKMKVGYFLSQTEYGDGSYVYDKDISLFDSIIRGSFEPRKKK